MSDFAIKFFGGLVILTALAIVFKNPGGSSQIITSLGNFNRTTFGTFLGAQPGNINIG